jgi:glycosyltransferase involved in cell wall biosynthesis
LLIGNLETLVSIVTVSLNSAKTIQDTLDSVRRQRAPFAIQHICVDGGSSDGTREIIARAALENPSITILFESDRGLFDAMNKGLGLAKGRYLLFLNSDDFLIGSSAVADAFCKIDLNNAAPDMIMGDVVMGNLDRIGLWRMRKVPRWLPKFPTAGAHPPHQGNFISRKILLQAGGFDIDQRLASDTTQFYRLAFERRATMATAKSVVSFMRMGGASNARFSSFGRGNYEIFLFLRKYRSAPGAACGVLVKVIQKLFECRIGRLRSRDFLNRG